MKYILISFLVLVFFIMSCQKPAGLEGLFPEDFSPGWKRVGSIDTYIPGALFEYINGEAELYLKYDFIELATAIYESDDLSVVVDIYDMGTPLNAFGLYSNYRHPRYRFDTIGAEAIVSDYGIRFYHGRYVVELKGSEASETMSEAMMLLAQEVSGNISAPTKPPELLFLLPEEGLIGKTERYAATEFMQQAFLPRGLEARYTLGDDDVTGFVVLFDDGDSAGEGFESLKSFYVESGDRMVLAQGIGENEVAFETKYHGFVLISLAGSIVVGVQDLPHPEVGLGLLARMKENVRVFKMVE